METGSFDGARRARLMRERVWAGYGVVGRPVYIGVLIHMYVYTRRETGDKNGERRPAITSTSGGAPPSAERNHPAGIERARIQEEPRWKTRAFDVDGVLRQ